MISKTTFRNAKIAHTLGNYFGIVPIKFNVNQSGTICKCNLIFSGKLWDMSSIFQILVRLVLVAVFLYQILFNTDMMPVDICTGMTIISFLLISIILLGASTVQNEDVNSCLNTLLGLNEYLCKSTDIYKTYEYVCLVSYCIDSWF